MAALATQDINFTGLVPSYAACTGGGDSFTPTGRTFLHVKNASGGALTVTVAVQATTATLAVSNVAVSVGAGAERMIGPFPQNLFADSTGQAQITYSGVTTLTIAVLRDSVPVGA